MESYEELLIQAINNDDLKCLQYWLSKGANPNKISSSGRTPLGVAAQHGNFSILRLLAENQRSSIKYKSSNDLCKQHKTLKLDFTLNKTQKRNIGYFVVCKDIDEGEFGDGPTPEGMEALEWDMEVTDDGLGDDTLCSTPPEARIYKWYADVLNRTAVVLESPENDIARFDKNGLNALHYAVIGGHCDIVEYLLDNFKEISVNQSDADMFSPLHMAALNGDLRMVKLLLEKRANVQFTNRQKHTPLHLAAQKGYVDVINLLIENGANINAHDLHDCSPLSLAILSCHEEAAELLIRKGTRLNHEEFCGITVVYRAVWNNMNNITKALLDGGAKIIQSQYLLHTAIRNNNYDMVKILHKGGAILNIRDEQGQTPLMMACVYNNIQISKYLLKHGAPVNTRNDLTGLTALHICVDSIREPKTFEVFLELLLSYGADINAGSFMGNILFHAIMAGNINAACMLIKYGADVNLKEERGFVDNLTLAKNNDNIELVKLIIYAGFNFSNMLFDMKCLKTKNEDSLYDFMASVSTKPLPLKDICRIRVRQMLNGNIMQKIYLLPLPTVLKRFLALEEL
ncbi:hypothetical protein RI129_005563 [Pyrocoelia pectoralis]|uniref:SOCS box domain-containing protein n=1 Tax=Pyrocoelia pectoralis TaxID=417401 RepID=A0AAN7VMZ6_9COLE